MKHKLKVAFLICGVEVDKQYNGSLISVVKCEVEHREKRFTNCIKIQYAIPIELDIDTSKQADINHLLLHEVPLFLNCFSLLLAQPSYLISHNTYLDNTEVKLERPPQTPLSLYNLATMFNHYPPVEIQRYSSVVCSTGWPLLENLVSELRKRPASLQNRLSLPLHWFKKGSNETSSLDRLVAYWISFNSLYADSNKGEKTAISNYIKSSVDSVIAQRYVESNERRLISLAGLQIELKQGKKKRLITQELGNLLKAEARDYLTIVEILALSIYGIRCNLFHGDYEPNSEVAQNHAKVAEYLLERLLKEIIAKQILVRPLPSTKFVVKKICVV